MVEPADRVLTRDQGNVANGYAKLDSSAKISLAQIPDGIGSGGGTPGVLNYAALAKNPDALIEGAVTGDPMTSAAVVWPDGVSGTLTIISRHATGAITSYSISYGGSKLYTQPGIQRATSGALTNVPAIVVTNIGVTPTLSVVSGGSGSSATPTTIISGGNASSAIPTTIYSGGTS